MFFREGILMHLDKQACCASYSATGTFRVWRAAQADRAMIPQGERRDGGAGCCVQTSCGGLEAMTHTR